MATKRKTAKKQLRKGKKLQSTKAPFAFKLVHNGGYTKTTS